MRRSLPFIAALGLLAACSGGGSITDSGSGTTQPTGGSVDGTAVDTTQAPTTTPPLDLLGSVRRKAEEQEHEFKRPLGKREPYIIVCCGVNGVGKTTSLAKLAFHLKDGGESVMIAACDSFRAGAVEQTSTQRSSVISPATTPW